MEKSINSMSYFGDTRDLDLGVDTTSIDGLIMDDDDDDDFFLDDKTDLEQEITIRQEAEHDDFFDDDDDIILSDEQLLNGKFITEKEDNPALAQIIEQEDNPALAQSIEQEKKTPKQPKPQTNEKLKRYTTYEDIDNNKLNNIIVPSEKFDDESKILDNDKLTPLCYDFIKYMCKNGCYPDNETFENYCIRLSDILFVGYEEQEVKESLNKDVEITIPDFSNIELNSLAQYVNSVLNVHLPANLLQYYISYPIEFFKYIAFPYRRATYEEIRLISECYQKDWYVDYVIPLFSLEARDTPLLLKLMENGNFDEKEALQYTNNLVKFREYLTLKNNGGYMQGIFNTIGNNQADMDLYNIFAHTIGDAAIAQALFAKNSSDKLAISKCLQIIKDKYDDGKITTVEGNIIDIVDFIREYETDPYFVELLKGVSNGIFSQELYKAILLVQPDNKQITTSLLAYYTQQPDLVKNYSRYGNIGIAIAATDICRFGYDYSDFDTDISEGSLNNAEINLDVISKTLTTLVCYYYSDLFDMSEKDYKQWLAIFSQDCLRYVGIVEENPTFDIAHFNKFWAAYAAHCLGFDNIEIDKAVQRFAIIKYKNKVQNVIPLDIFIYQDDSTNMFLEELKLRIDYVTYDQVNKLLFVGKYNHFGAHKRPFAMLRSSLEFVAMQPDITDYELEDRYSLIQHFNLFSIGKNIDKFCEKSSSLYEMEYSNRVKNFTQNCQIVLDLNSLQYLNYDAIFYVISQIEPEYSLITYCENSSTFSYCLNIIRSLYYLNTNSLSLFKNFILRVYQKDVREIANECSSKLITVVNDSWLTQKYNNPITLEIFLKEIDYFVKMARNLKADLSHDRNTGGICIDYKLQ